ncbi:MAG: D-sedoheptulose 7-phosphate isomerase [Acidobacteria bacterium]|nr:D-sedoheptulose 7-phosphate isomerase [Acidobacteriota bacterium]
MPSRKAADRTWIDQAVSEHLETVQRFMRESGDEIAETARWMADSLAAGSTLLFFGNGGSAADAQHMAAELVNRFRAERPALRALALTTDTSVLTSISNDAEYRAVFSRQIEALGRKGDIAVGISTSGCSANVIEGLRVARQRGLQTLGILGRDGGTIRALCDRALVVTSQDTARIQETHLLIYHLLCEWIDRAFSTPPAD